MTGVLNPSLIVSAHEIAYSAVKKTDVKDVPMMIPILGSIREGGKICPFSS